MPETNNTSTVSEKHVGELIDDVMKQSQETLEKGARITSELNELRRRADDALDWRKQLRERPWVQFGLAVGACVLVAAVVFSRR